MKKLSLILLLALGTSVQAQIVDLYRKPPEKEAAAAQGTLRHVVLFKFREGTPGDTIRRIEEAFYSLPAKIPEIRGFEWGLNNSPEGADKGFTHCYLLTFSSEEDRATYLPHPEHKAFGTLISPWL